MPGMKAHCNLSRFSAWIMVVLVSGCSGAAIGEPPLVTRADANERILHACSTVRSDAPVVAFNTQYYLTTWGSAVAEGTAVGLREGLKEGRGAGFLALQKLRPLQSVQGEKLLWRGVEQVPFCMVIAADEDRVSTVLGDVFRDLGRYGYRARQFGPLQMTNFVKRDHSAAKWMDRFSAFTYELPGNMTALVVRRDVLISRGGSEYVQANSVGALESWVLTQTRDRAVSR